MWTSTLRGALLLTGLILLGETKANECDDIDLDFAEFTDLVQIRRNDRFLLRNLPKVLEKIQCLDMKLSYLVEEVESMQRNRRSPIHQRSTSTRKFIHKRNRY
ncbi:uncharacterized protein LOC110455644 [Mizuhopecten yessoensis]|uniref:Uncharacterized protein n=1 Tax=Mizuhopecten yessoensis TaxID=6573 RepID=A0A210QCR6_MIZYE|nr:uncharacterized protein LOC110455644 [Mizuhopecten yessoensis]OWF46511.1 hypothetical protein KP79_PYT01427 [Mizuhopecten yessoensis]